MKRAALRKNWPNIMYLFHWSGKFPFCSLNCHPSLRPTPPPPPLPLNGRQGPGVVEEGGSGVKRRMTFQTILLGESQEILKTGVCGGYV